jgi:hypothetical protein
MPILWALANPTIGEREVLAAMLQIEAGVVAEHDGILPCVPLRAFRTGDLLRSFFGR